MADLFYPSHNVPRNRPIRIRQEMQLHVPRVGGGLGRIVPRNVDEYPAWMFTGRVPRDDRQIGSDYQNGAFQPLNLVVRDPRRWQNNDTRASRDIARGTLNEYHVNLESEVGRYFKQAWDMPYKEHSQVDPLKAALQAQQFMAPDALGEIFGSSAEPVWNSAKKVAAGTPLNPAMEQWLQEIAADAAIWQGAPVVHEAYQSLGLGSYVIEAGKEQSTLDAIGMAKVTDKLAALEKAQTLATKVEASKTAGGYFTPGMEKQASSAVAQAQEALEHLPQGQRRMLEAATSRGLFENSREIGPSEAEALALYQRSAAINDHLRGGALRKSIKKVPGLYDTAEARDAFMQSLDRATTLQKAVKPTSVWRGLYAEGELREKFRPGQIVRDPGYSSTTIRKGVAAGFATTRAPADVAAEVRADRALVLDVRLPRGYRLSAHLVQRLEGVGTGQDEAEILLRRGAPMRIRAEERMAEDGGYTLLHAEALRFARGRRLPVPAATAAEAATPALLKDGLQQIHVNLESRTGQALKRVLKLPFRRHSRLDDEANATWAQELLSRFERRVTNGVIQFSGADRIGPQGYGAMEGRIPSYLAQLEIHAHGGGRHWGVSALDTETISTQRLFEAALQQERVNSVLVSACNAQSAYLSVPEGVSAIQGLGRGYHRSLYHSELEAQGHGGFYSWRDAVVLHHGSTSQIIPKNALEAQMGRGLTGTGPVAPGVDEGTIGFFQPAAGEMRVGFFPKGLSTEALLEQTVPLSQAPMVTRTVAGGSERFFVGQEEHASLEAATRSLVSRFKPAAANLWEEAMPLGMAAAGPAENLLGPAEQALLSRASGKGLGSFKTHGWAGILLGGAALGALLLGRSQNDPSHGGPIPMVAVQPDARGNRFQPDPSRIAPQGPTESDQTQVRHRAGGRGAYRAKTVVELSDHPLDQEHLDRAFAHHLRTGFAQV